jgi:hypothetical protein
MSTGVRRLAWLFVQEGHACMVAAIHEELIAVDVGMTVMGAPLSKSRTGSVAAERSSHSLQRRALKYIFRASAHDDFLSQQCSVCSTATTLAEATKQGAVLTLGQFSHCCDQFRHRGMGAVPHRQGPLAVARGGKACGVATPGSAAFRDPRSARSQVSRPRASPTSRERKTEREYEACAFGWPVLTLGLL